MIINSKKIDNNDERRLANPKNKNPSIHFPTGTKKASRNLLDEEIQKFI